MPYPYTLEVEEWSDPRTAEITENISHSNEMRSGFYFPPFCRAGGDSCLLAAGKGQSFKPECTFDLMPSLLPHDRVVAHAVQLSHTMYRAVHPTSYFNSFLAQFCTGALNYL